VVEIVLNGSPEVDMSLEVGEMTSFIAVDGGNTGPSVSIDVSDGKCGAAASI
jgi:hypothetical protein